MEEKLLAVVEDLQKKFSITIETFRGEAHVIVQSGQLVELLTYVRDQQQFELMSALTAVDYYPQMAPRFHVIYQMTSISNNLSMQIRVPVAGDKPVVPTVTGLFGSANWRERELWDMFGVTPEGHPDLRRILMPDDWEGHPLRKDYPLGYEEPQFTFNYEEIQLGKPQPKE